MTVTSPETRNFEGVTIPGPGEFAIDTSHSTVQFVARHMMVSRVRGTFADYSGKIVVAEDPLASEVEVQIEAASITTGDEGRDTHLKSADFFDVEQFPQIRFKSHGVKPLKDGRFEVTGDVSIRDVTRSITLEVQFEGIGTDPWGTEKIGFSTSIELDREEFGLTWNQALETGGVLVGKKVKLEIDIEADRIN